MLKNITKKYEPSEIEKNITQYWDKDDSYKKTRDNREKGKKFYFVDGPPYTTGHIHLGTAWNKIIKDSILRYTSMKGYDVLDTPGWDMHGLPIEVKVEEILGFKTKKDIEKFGVSNFIQECKKFSITNKEAMTNQFKRLGVWMDWDKPYMTLTDEYIESAWWVTKAAQEKNLLETGRRVVNWCPRCETAIADSEVEYWDKKDPSVFVKFPVLNRENTFIVIWTTTPWTIPSNVSIAVHPDLEYAEIEAKKEDGTVENLIFAKDLIPEVLKKGKYVSFEIVKTIQGTEVEGLEYISPFAEEIPFQKETKHQVYTADYVAAENTGCVHIAPGHGLDDFNVGIKHNLPIFCPVGPDGTYTKDAGKYTSMNIIDANPIIINDIDEKNLLLFETETLHRYGHCWRCKTPIIFLATKQWFMDIVKVKEIMLDEIENVDWFPDWAGSARFKDWVEGARDWCISRQRYWGIPIPIWECTSCDKITVIGTKDELIEKAGIKGDIELHRPYVDEIELKCECGCAMKRTEDVFDVWFDSAMASWATLGFPKNKDGFDQLWPADFITEGQDQTRGWFYSQLGASVIAFGKAPYKSVLMHGFTLDSSGKKMSKSIGNVITPEEVIEKHGVDSLRAYVLSANAPWDDLKFNWDEIGNVTRTINILWNVYKFPLPYMVLDKFDPREYTLDSVKAHMRPEDKWILSRLQTLIENVENAMDSRLLHRAVRFIFNFILEDLSRWYIQLIRPRTWTEADDPDKIAAYTVLYEISANLTKIIAPFMPYLAEEMYQNLVLNVYENDENTKSSVHMTDWPKIKYEFKDPELEEYMEIIRSIVEASSNARQKVGRKLRWPISKIVIESENEKVNKAVIKLKDVLLDQTNSKDAIVLKPKETWKELIVQITPNQSVIGPKFKKDGKKVADLLMRADPESLKEAFSYVEVIQTEMDDGTSIEITKDMVIFEEIVPEGTAVSNFTEGNVYVDARLTKELEAEGYSREVIRRIQDMRKQFDLNVEDMISVDIEIEDDYVKSLIESMENIISNEVRAKDYNYKKDVTGDLIIDWDIEGVKMNIGIKKA
ncbi:MAG: isoleucine--tRNA ligase [Methanosarcinaceae archaeon]|nr:isoleucine--tRNA ligase [Methanosarcinaceae archaeon]